MCEIQGIGIPDLQNRTLYVPLSRRDHPKPMVIIEYHLERLPLHSHDSFIVQAKSVVSAPTEIQ